MGKYVKSIDDRFDLYYLDENNNQEKSFLNNLSSLHERRIVDRGENSFVYCVWDNQKSIIAGYCIVRYNNVFSALWEASNDELYISRIEMIDKDPIYRNKGLGTHLIEAVVDYAKEHNSKVDIDEKYNRIFLYSIDDNATQFYWKNGFVYISDKEMIKEVDPDIWLNAVFFSECMHRARKNKTKLYDEISKMIDNKDYDKLFEYAVVKEDIYNSKYDAKKSFLQLDYLIHKKILKSEYFKRTVSHIQKCMNSNNYLTSLKKYFLKEKEYKNKNKIINDKINNVCSDMYLLEREKIILSGKNISKLEYSEKI